MRMMTTYEIRVQATTYRDIIITADTRAEARAEAMKEMKALVGGEHIIVGAMQEIDDDE